MINAECIAQEVEVKEANQSLAAEHVRSVVGFIEPEIIEKGMEGIDVTMEDLLCFS